MKKIFNIFTIGALTALSFTSCQRDLTSLNDDPKHPSVLPSQNLLAMGQQQFFYYTFTPSVNFNNFSRSSGQKLLTEMRPTII
jgi:hypothetical protein